MAEIKSTLDIIMEKTKHLVLSSEEKLQLERNEHLRKVPGYIQRYLDGVWSLDDLLEAIAMLSDEHRHPIKEELIRRLVMEVSFQARGRKCLQALQNLAADEHRGKVAELCQLLDRFDASYHELVALQAEQLKTQLAALGISGSAVLGRGEMNHAWETKSQEYESQLRGLQASW
jgi:hypothetical protein